MPENEREPIKGKVVSIVTDRNVFINRGDQDGVTEGMWFAVHLPLGIIEDPDDHTNTLDGVVFTKAKLEVTTVYDRMSYCAIKSTRRGSPLLWNFGGLVGKPEYPEIDAIPSLSQDDWKLRRGDPVQEIVSDGEESESE